MEHKYPHHPDVLEREHLDNGFSRGWALHAKPQTPHFYDCHIHYSGPTEGTICQNIASDAKKPYSLGVKGAMVMLQTYGKRWNPSMSSGEIMDKFPYFTIKELEERLAGFSESPHTWAVYLNYHSPEVELVNAVADMGCCCIKLHNAALIEDNAPPDIWLNKEWSAVFEAIQRRNMAVIWHVTQRRSASAYTWGARNAYWQKGWANGTTFTNEDLLQVFLTCCNRYPGIKFIGAHQLHIGWERTEELFAAHPNLYVDTSTGGQLKLDEDFYPHDRDYLREMFIRNASRVLFGTDTFWGSVGRVYDHTSTLQHIRYIKKLDLPQEELELIAYLNSERLLQTIG